MIENENEKKYRAAAMVSTAVSQKEGSWGAQGACPPPHGFSPAPHSSGGIAELENQNDVSGNGCLSFYVGPEKSWRLTQGDPSSHQKAAGIGSSTPLQSCRGKMDRRMNE